MYYGLRLKIVEIGLWLVNDPDTKSVVPVHVADFLPHKSASLWVLLLRFWENIFVAAAPKQLTRMFQN